MSEDAEQAEFKHPNSLDFGKIYFRHSRAPDPRYAVSKNSKGFI